MKQKVNANGEEEKKDEEESKEPRQGTALKPYDGLIHYFKDAEGVWQEVRASEYESRSNDLPDICFASHYPIEGARFEVLDEVL